MQVVDRNQVTRILIEINLSKKLTSKLWKWNQGLKKISVTIVEIVKEDWLKIVKNINMLKNMRKYQKEQALKDLLRMWWYVHFKKWSKKKSLRKWVRKNLKIIIDDWE